MSLAIITPLAGTVDRSVSLRKKLDMAVLELVNMVVHLYLLGKLGILGT